MSAHDSFPTRILWGARDELLRTAPETWGERWSTIRSAVEQALQTGQSETRDGWTFVPLVQNGVVVGLACVAHPAAIDVRSPLTLLLGPLDQLLAGDEDPLQVPREELERLYGTVVHLQDLVEGRGKPATSESATGTSTSESSGALPGRPRVLVVEDHDDLREYMAGALSDEWTVDVARDGEHALECVVRARPDVVLSDLTMEGLDGAALFRVLRSNPRTSEIPLILVTARTREQARIAGTEVAADDYLSKPFTIAELKARVRTQLEVTRARREARRDAEGDTDDFLSMIGHELRNPLSTLSTTLQAMLLRGGSSELELMDRAVRQLGRLVEDLLESSRLSRGKIQLQRRVVELAQIVDRAVELVGPAAEDKQVQLAFSVPRTGCRIDADAERLARAISNVLTNAVQHTPRGGYVRCEAQHAGRGVRMTIVDKGAGIAAERLGMLFRAFQADRKSGGLGLGLAIARNIIELHGGTIAVHSEGIGLGAACTIELATTDASAEQVAKPRAAVRRRLLLVEDNDDAARALKSALEQLGYEVALAHDAPIAINLARTFQPHVALLDLGLPVMDGWELARRLRGAARTLPIVAVTARDQESDKQRSAEVGFAAHLVKPIDLAQLERIVESIADQSATS